MELEGILKIKNLFHKANYAKDKFRKCQHYDNDELHNQAIPIAELT